MADSNHVAQQPAPSFRHGRPPVPPQLPPAVPSPPPHRRRGIYPTDGPPVLPPRPDSPKRVPPPPPRYGSGAAAMARSSPPPVVQPRNRSRSDQTVKTAHMDLLDDERNSWAPMKRNMLAKKAIMELENGLVVHKLTNKRRPEALTLILRPDLAEMLLIGAHHAKPVSAVDLLELKEVVPNPRARLARIYTEETFKEKSECCFTVFSGSQFLLKDLTILVAAKDFKMIQVALEDGKEDIQCSTYYKDKERWLNREFNKIRISNAGFSHHQKNHKSQRKSIDLDSDDRIKSGQVRSWFKLQTTLPRNFFTLVKGKLNLPDKLDSSQFALLVSEILQPNPVVHCLMKEYGVALPDGSRQLPMTHFDNFLRTEQKESDTSDIAARISSCVPLETKFSFDFNFSNRQLEDYLYSPHNSIINPGGYRVHQNMDHSLCHYWIASSHNTYLTGDQWGGESHVETYTRTLQMGCRCIELDCWDGPDGKPIITHGKTFTSKIKFSDVIYTIKEHAWEVSEYPLVLSIENHCCLAQQRIMASLLKDVFQDELLTKQVDPNEQCLPSPSKLMRKVIIKNKKLSTNKAAPDVIEPSSEVTEELMSRAKKHSVLLIKFATEEKWNNFRVMITDSHICFTPNILETETEEEQEEDDLYANPNEAEQLYDLDDEDSEEANPLTSNLWYHGAISRNEANQLLLNHRCHGNGTFLVRDSGQGGKALSFLAQGAVTHSIIKARTSDSTGQEQYLIGNEVWHNSIQELVEYYKTHKLNYKEKGFSIELTFPVPKELEFNHEQYYYPELDRKSAENFLRLIPIDGVFLIRQSSVENCFSLTLRHRRRISHFQIEYCRGKFVLSGLRFASMERLILHFSMHALYKTAKLTQPAREELIQEEHDSNGELYLVTDYADLKDGKDQVVTARALYDYIAATPDELSFKRGAYITNVVVADQPWWRGDHGNDINKLFPANYVQVMDESSELVDKTAPNEAVLNLSSCHFADKLSSADGVHFFTLTHPLQPYTIEMGSRNMSEAQEWLLLALDSWQKMGVQVQQMQKAERSEKLAQELSDLVIYCQSVPYEQGSPFKFKEMSSFSEERISKDDKYIVHYNQNQISRVYPKFLRIKSTNFDPVPKWNMGCQMVALNYQTPDKSMQVNQAMFSQNGRCGYVLKPNFMQEPYYHPNNVATLKGDVESIFLTVEILGGRLLGSNHNDGGVLFHYVAIEVIGLPIDCQAVRTETLKEKNCLNPVWKNQEFTFPISCPDLALIRFEVRSDVNDGFLISQATIPLKSVRSGYRSVQLKNAWSEPIPLSSLLVHVDMRNPREDEEKNLFKMLEETRKLYADLQTSDPSDTRKQEQLLHAEQKLLQTLDGIRGRGMRSTWRQSRAVPPVV